MTQYGNINQYWSLEHEKYLKDHYSTTPNAELAIHLGRTVGAIRTKAQFLHLSKYRVNRKKRDG